MHSRAGCTPPASLPLLSAADAALPARLPSMLSAPLIESKGNNLLRAK